MDHGRDVVGVEPVDRYEVEGRHLGPGARVPAGMPTIDREGDRDEPALGRIADVVVGPYQSQFARGGDKPGLLGELADGAVPRVFLDLEVAAGQSPSTVSSPN